MIEVPSATRCATPDAGDSVRASAYSYEHMFQVSIRRIRALMTLVDDVLGDPETPPAPHPHRRPVRIARDRRPGAVAPRPAHCLSPVRHAAERPAAKPAA